VFFRAFFKAAAVVAAAFLCAAMSISAQAQNFSQFYGFGDSTIDSGWYRNAAPNSTNSTYNADFPAGLAAGGGKATTNPGQSNSEMLAGKFGLTANPANTPGGTNYATGDARNNQFNTPSTGGLQGAVPTVTQIDNYLLSSNGMANAGALYVISSGGNDILFAENNLAASARAAYVATAGSDLVAAVARLQAAGARYIVVPNQPESFGAGDLRSLRSLYDNTVWFGLAGRGVNFIPADINAVYRAIFANPASFGFQFVSNSGTGPACTRPTGITSGWATFCSPTSPISTLVSPDAAQTHLFADDVHLTTAGQQIVADYEYSLVVAPSQVSFLPEAQAKTRTAIVNTIFNRIPLSQRQRGPSGFNVWVSGDISFLKMSNANGFPDDPGNPAAVSAGIDYKIANDWIFGAAVSVATTKQSFSTTGDFRQSDYAASLYAGYRQNPVWLNAVATVGYAHFDVNRNVPMGNTVQKNNGSSNGTNASVAVEGGYDVTTGKMTSGPVAGITLQHIKTAGFTETGSFTSLSFGYQTRNSAISELGYQARYDAGWLQPFAKLAWNHEAASTDRQVTASLTTIAAPDYSMPAVVLGKDWDTGYLGTSLPMAANTSATIVVSSEFAQKSVTSYGAQAGLSVTF
jgi:outer membrane lipase/esterase